MINRVENFVENPKALFVFAHGAGADMHHDFMAQITLLMNAADINVIRFNFPYMIKRAQDGKRRPPDRMPALLASYSAELTALATSLPIFIGGKSMGGRVAASLTNECSVNIQGIICLSYPFHPVKKPLNLRLAPLQANNKPMLIIQGERDPLGNAQEIKQYDLPDLCQVHFLHDGDHDLKPRVKSGFTQQQHLIAAVTAMVAFINEYS